MDRYERLKNKFKNCENIFGTQLTVTHSTIMLEKMDREDLDFMLFDCEHGIYNSENLVPLLQVTRLLKLPNIVRVPYCEYPFIAKVLDLGADGIMIPRVEELDQVKRAIDAVKFWPIGKTGNGGWGQFRKGENIKEYQDNRFLIIQIESPKGIENLPEMLEKYGDQITSVIVGPYDLSIMLGVTGDVCCDLELKNMKKIFDICKKHHISCGTYCANKEQAEKYKEIGAEVFWFSHDLNFILRGYEETFAEVKKASEDK